MSSPSPALTVTLASDFGSDAQSDLIYEALLSAAKASRVSPPAATPTSNAMFGLTLAEPVHFAAVSNSTLSHASLGFMTDRMQALPSAVSAVVGILLILLGLGALAAGARSLFFGAEWGKQRGTQEGKTWLGGGVGGIGLGSVGLGGISTALLLVIIGRQSDPSLGSWGVLAIVLCSSLIGAVLGGRFRWASRMFCALMGSTSLVLLFTLSFRISSLLPRLVLFAILLPIALLASFFSRTAKVLSICSALAGAWILTLGVDCFAHLGFVDAVGLLVVANGVSVDGKATEMVVHWGEGGAKGLLAGWWLLALVGGAWQCWWGGENGEADEAWDSYLARFITSNPSSRGAYSPPRSFLARLFSSSSRPSAAFTDMPGRRRRSPWNDDEEKASGEHVQETSDAWDSDVDTATLKESEAPARYRAKGQMSDSGDEDEDDELRRVKRGLWSPRGGAEDYDEMGMKKMGDVRTQSILSGSTMIGGGSGAGSVGKTRLAQKQVEDSDSEEEGEEYRRRSTNQQADDEAEDARLVASLPTLSDHGAESRSHKKTSTFRNIFSNRSSKPASYRSGPASVSTARHSSSTHLASSTSSAPPNAVPVTPSLIHALTRVQEAQRQARANSLDRPERSSIASEESGLSEVEGGRRARGRRASYDEWWKEVIAKGGK